MGWDTWLALLYVGNEHIQFISFIIGEQSRQGGQCVCDHLMALNVLLSSWHGWLMYNLHTFITDTYINDLE